MKRSRMMKTLIHKSLAIGALALAAAPVYAIDYYLAAKAYDKTLPDGSTVPMWGYVVDTGNGVNATCYSITGGGSRALRNTCVAGLPDPGTTNPRLDVPPGDTQLRIFLTNGLPEPTSVIIDGQELPWSNNNNGPTWDDGSLGSRGANTTKRVRSYGREAISNGGRRPYVWNNFRGTPFVKNGSFVYRSGTLPQKQVYMGLAGLVTRDSAANEAHPGVSYDNEVVLFYSDIDPDFNAAVANGTLTTAIDYHAKWFLINGESYDPGMPDIAAGEVGTNTLIRFASSASENHVPVMQGMHMTIHAEDGIPYTWQDGSTGASTPAPIEQWSLKLPPLKTKDVIVTTNTVGRKAVYDGNGYMTNPTDPGDFNVGDDVGGMLAFLDFAAAGGGGPVDNDNDGFLSDVDCNDNDPTINPGATEFCDGIDNNCNNVVDDNPVNLDDGIACTLDQCVGGQVVHTGQNAVCSDGQFCNGDEICNISVGCEAGTPPVLDDGNDCTADSCDETNDVVLNLPVADGTACVGGTCTSGVCVAPGSPPVAVADAYSVNEDAILDVPAGGVLMNDTDAQNDILEAVLITGPNCAWTDGPSGTGAFVLNPNGSFHYEPIPNWNSDLSANPFCNFTGDDSFTYLARDVDGDSNVVTVTITVNEMNDAPVAVADVRVNNNDDNAIYLTNMGTVVIPAPGILANDNDVDLIPFDPASLTAVQETNPNRGTMNAFPGDGGFTYTFNNGRINVIATFDYHANDGLANSNSVTVQLRRDLSIQEATCEYDGETNTCDWRVQGRVSGLVPNGTTLELWLGDPDTGVLVGTAVETGGAAYSINVNGSNVIPTAGNNLISVRAATPVRPNAYITDYAVSVP